MKKKEAGEKSQGQDSVEKKLSRRLAIKRIAATFAGAVVASKAFKQAQQGFQVAYMSNPPHNPYSETVYGSWTPSYYSIVYYTSYSSHYSSVPPPYISSR